MTVTYYYLVPNYWLDPGAPSQMLPRAKSPCCLGFIRRKGERQHEPDQTQGMASERDRISSGTKIYLQHSVIFWLANAPQTLTES